MGKFVSIETKDGRIFDGVHVEGWQSYQEALNNETESRLVRRGKVSTVWDNGEIIKF